MQGNLDRNMMSKSCILIPIAVLLMVSSVLWGAEKQANNPTERHRDFYLAYRMYQDKMYDLAASEFLDFARNHPGHVNSGEALFLAGESLFKIGEYDRARTAYLTCAIEYPLDSRVIPALTQAAACWEALSQPYQAGEAYYRVYMQAPDDDQSPIALMRSGGSYMEADSLVQARDMFETYLDRFSSRPDAVDATLALAEISARQGSPEGAEAEFSRALETATTDSVKEKILWRWFQTVHRDGDYVAALHVGDRLIAGYPKSGHVPSVQRYLGEMALLADDASEAEKRLTEALKSKDSSKEVSWLRAIARWHKGDWDGVLEDVGNDTALAAQLLRGMALQEKGQYDQARNIYIDCLARDWGGPYGLKALERLSTLPSILSIQEFDRLPGLEALPDSANRGLWLSYFLRVIPADRVFQNDRLLDDLIARANSQYSDDLLYSRALWRVRRGAWDLAQQDFSRLLSAFPASEWVMSSYRYDQALRTAAVPVSDRFEALGDLLANQSLNPAKVTTNDIAWCYFNNFRDYSRAKEWFQKTMTAPGASPDSKNDANIGMRLCNIFQSRLDTWRGNPLSQASPDSLIQDLRTQIGKSASSKNYQPYLLKSITLFEEEYQSGKLPIDPIVHLLAADGDSALSVPRDPQLAPLLVTYHLRKMTADTTKESKAHRRAIHRILDKNALHDLDSLCKAWAEWQKASLQLQDSANASTIEATKRIARSRGPFQVDAVLELVDYLPTPEERIPFLVFARETVPYHRDYRKVCMKLGDQYFLAKRYEDALKAFSAIEESETVTSDPFLRLSLTTDDLEYKLGSVYRALGRHNEAMMHFRRYLTWNRYGSTAEAALYALGRTEEDRDFPLKALDYYRHLHRFFQGSDYDKLGMIRMGEILWRQEDYDGAAKVYEELKTIFPSSEDAAKWDHRRTICLYRGGKLSNGDAAKAQFEKDFKKNADYDMLEAELDLESGKALAQAKRTKDADKIFNNLAKKYNGKSLGAEASYELGKLKLKENPEDGLDVLTKIPTQYPKATILPDVYVTLGVFYYQNQQLENALQAFQNALAAVQGEPKILKDVLNNLVVTYRDMGLWDAALSALQRSLLLYPEDYDVGKSLEQGQFLMHVGETDRAIEVLKRQLDQARGDDILAVQFYIGEAYFQKGLYAKAAAEYMKVVYADVPSKLDWVVTAIYQAGQSYERMGKPQKAIDLYKDIIKRQGRESPYSRGAQARIDELQQRESLLRQNP
jgi:tetratricopeptide (TPR) repeat protein